MQVLENFHAKWFGASANNAFELRHTAGQIYTIISNHEPNIKFSLGLLCIQNRNFRSKTGISFAYVIRHFKTQLSNTIKSKQITTHSSYFCIMKLVNWNTKSWTQKHVIDRT